MGLTSQTHAVLAALLSDPGHPHYGLEIAQEADLKSGTIYPILARLERMGWVSSEWEEIDEAAAGRRRRRYYRLTGDGASAASHELFAAARRLERAGFRILPVPEKGAA